MAPMQLRAGVLPVRRDTETLQFGIDAPGRVVAADTAAVRRVAGALARGEALPDEDVRDPDVAWLLQDLQEAGLLVTPRQTPHVDIHGPDDLVEALRLHLPALDSDTALTVEVARGPIARERVDPLMREGRPHLVVAGGPDGWSVGPLVVPGLTACLRCVDAAATAQDARRSLVIEQYAQAELDDGDPITRHLALAYAAREARLYALGHRPATWSAVVHIGATGEVVARPVARHRDCGCAWDIVLASA